MPVIRDIPLSLETAEVLRRQGLGREAKAGPETNSLTRELLASLRRSHLLERAAAYKYYTVRSMTDSQISLEGDKALRGPLLPAIAPQAKEFAVVLRTIGARLERRVAHYSKNGAALQGLILGGIRGAAVDRLVSEVLALIAAEVSSRGHETSSPVNPGMPGFPLTEQWHLLRLVNSDEIRVRLTASGVLGLRKSTSMVIGIGSEMTRWTQAEVCARRSLGETCHYKVAR